VPNELLWVKNIKNTNRNRKVVVLGAHLLCRMDLKRIVSRERLRRKWLMALQFKDSVGSVNGKELGEYKRALWSEKHQENRYGPEISLQKH